MADEPVVLVTGANKGLGRETARQLALRGARVFLGRRDAERGAAAAAELAAEGVEVVPVPLDVIDAASVADVAEQLRTTHGRLDVLVNNAGTVQEQPAVAMSAAGMREVFEVNVFGVATVIHAMLPLLRRSPTARIVNVSSTTASLHLTSSGADFGGNGDRRAAYTSSKAALNMLTVQYAQAFAADPELAPLRINSATPGYTATDLTGHRGTRTVAEGARILVELATADAADPRNGGFHHEDGQVPW